MGRRRLEKRLQGLLSRTEDAQRETAEPALHLRRLSNAELQLLDRLIARYVDNWGQFDAPEQLIWWTALLAKAFALDSAIPATLPEPPELPHPGSYTEETERGGLFTTRPEPSDPRLLDREEEGETEDRT